jgi:hypothetical protein
MTMDLDDLHNITDRLHGSLFKLEEILLTDNMLEIPIAFPVVSYQHGVPKHGDVILDTAREKHVLVPIVESILRIHHCTGYKVLGEQLTDFLYEINEITYDDERHSITIDANYQIEKIEISVHSFEIEIERTDRVIGHYLLKKRKVWPKTETMELLGFAQSIRQPPEE